MHTSLLRLAACLLIMETARAEGYQGAQALLERLQPATQAEEHAAIDAKGLARQLEAFQRAAGNLEPEAAAKRWLTLFDAFAALPARRHEGGSADLGTLIESLPPATAWGALEKEIAATSKGRPQSRQLALRVLMAALNGTADVPALSEAVKTELKRGRGFFGSVSNYEIQQLADLKDALNRRNGQAPDPIATAQELLRNTRATESLRVPAGLARAANAEAWVAEALRKGVKLTTHQEATRRLIVKVLAEQPDLLKTPQWELVTSIHDLPLAETLLQRFPTSDSGRWSRQKTEQVVLAGRILQGRHAEALKGWLASLTASDAASFSNSLFDSKEFRQAVASKPGDPLRQFMESSLNAVPVLPLWQPYIRHMAATGHSKEARVFLETHVGQAPEGSNARRLIENHLIGALLAAGDTERGVPRLRAFLSASNQEPQKPTEAERAKLADALHAAGVEASPKLIELLASFESMGASRRETDDYALKLVELGRLLKQPEWMDEGFAVLLRSGKENDSSYSNSQIVEAFLKAGRGPAAEALIASRLERHSQDESGAYEDASLLAEIYRRAGRYDDVVTLLDRFRSWNAADLADVETHSFTRTSPQLAAAEAFFHQGKKDVALALVKRVLQSNPGRDDAYRLRIQLGGDGLVRELEGIAAVHPFQERPLIWKAKFLLDAGRLDEAEKTIRAAIAIDPSDGEQGKGDRMRAYSILADVLAKKGDAENARVFRGAVKAVRLSEDADDWWQAGLLAKAIGMYEEALTHFADAYCIQSRLALRYSETGDLENAEKHYQRAFELMPDSFGRVESHCFGCEGIFNGSTSQTVAERVFTKLAAEKPGHPQIHYLLGYLRENQKRYAEAAASFRRAVELDPDYLNAWKKLGEIADEIETPDKERDAIAFALFRLGRAPDALRTATDLPRAWSEILKTEAALPPRLTGPIYPLAASAEALKAAQTGNDFSQRHIWARYYPRYGQDQSLRAGFVDNQMVSAAKDIIERLLNRN
jgi:tetratricopeptide (TPR) repeat protein